MTDKTDETGKGPSRPGEAPKRPYATIELQATEIGKARGAAAATGGTRQEAGAADSAPSLQQRLSTTWATLATWLAVARTWALRLARSSSFLSHAAAGVAGAAVTWAAIGLLGLLAGQGSERVGSDLARRLATVEKALAQGPVLPENLPARLTAADTRLGKLEERAAAAEAQRAADSKAFASSSAASDLAERIAKLEAAVAALPAGDKTAGASSADVEKLAAEAGEATAATERSERELAALKTESAGLRRNLEALKGSLDERLKDAAKAGELTPLLTRLAALEREVGGVLKTEGDRAASARQVLLTLELANLQRALDRGDSYERELDAVRKAAGDAVDVTALERSSRTGVPPLGTLVHEFRHVADTAADAANERPDASVLDRLVSGAKSVVRLRKAKYDADDTSAEATLARMEAALKDGRIDEVLAQGKRLPPKAAAAAADWLRRLEARSAADRAVAGIEASLKASLTHPPVPEAKR
jgi:hypothetical protein